MAMAHFSEGISGLGSFRILGSNPFSDDYFFFTSTIFEPVRPLNPIHILIAISFSLLHVWITPLYQLNYTIDV
jgi:hypothetical protein